MNGANNKLSGVSTYPFYIFANGWEKATPEQDDLPYKGDTVIRNGVWIVYETLIMPGVRVSYGTIIAAKSVVVDDILYFNCCWKSGLGDQDPFFFGTDRYLGKNSLVALAY